MDVVQLFLGFSSFPLHSFICLPFIRTFFVSFSYFLAFIRSFCFIRFTRLCPLFSFLLPPGHGWLCFSFCLGFWLSLTIPFPPSFPSVLSFRSFLLHFSLPFFLIFLYFSEHGVARFQFFLGFLLLPVIFLPVLGASAMPLNQVGSSITNGAMCFVGINAITT